MVLPFYLLFSGSKYPFFPFPNVSICHFGLVVFYNVFCFFFFQFPLFLCFMSLLYIYVLWLLWSLYKTPHNPFFADSLLSSFAYTGSILFFFPYFTFYYLLLCCCHLVAKLCQLFVTTWIIAHQAPLSVEFPRQEHWSGLPSLSPSFAHFKNQVFFFFISFCWILKFFMYSGCKSLVRYIICKYFPQFVACLFIPLMGPLK